MGSFEPVISERINAVKPSATLAVGARAKQLKSEGKDIINLAAGEPDFNTPQFVIDSAYKAMNEGNTKYTPVSGMLELRQEISKKFKKDNNLDYSPEQIILTVGAKHALYNVFQVILNPDDEILIPTPYWVSYKEMANLASAKPVFVETSSDDNYYLHIDKLEACLTKKTRAILINSPNNPTGHVYQQKNIEEIAAFAVKHNILIITDEIYEKLTYEEANFFSIGSLGPEVLERTITVNGLSKSHSMTGWRVGYIAGPLPVIKGIAKIQSHCTSNITSFCQSAAITALQDTSNLLQDNLQTFRKRRDLLVDGLSAIEGIVCRKPHGAFYAFPDVSSFFGKTVSGKKIENSLDFCAHLLDTQYVAAVPGIAFGNDNHIRMSYATSEDQLNSAITRIKDFLKG